MKLSVIEESDERVRIALAGLLDFDGVRAIDGPFREALEGPQSFFIVDMSRVEYVASMGMAMFVEAFNALRGRGGCMVLLDLQDEVEKTFRSFNMDKLIPLARGEEEAARIDRTRCRQESASQRNCDADS